VPTRNTALALRLVNDRANLLPADKVIEEASLDKYSYVRDAYLQRRRSLIYDGNAPREVEDDIYLPEQHPDQAK
jgi:phospholipid-binding lipoprotein MlaA